MAAVSQAEVISIATSVVASKKLDTRLVEIITKIVDHECYKFVDDGITYYRISMSGTFKGLGQFSSTTWKSLERMYPDVLEKGYSFVGTPYHDICAIAALCMDSRSYYRKKTGKDLFDSFELVYLFHNQGAPGAMSFLQTGVVPEPGQSDRVIAMFNSINRADALRLG